MDDLNKPSAFIKALLYTKTVRLVRKKEVFLGGKLAMLKISKTALKPLKRRDGAQNVYDGARRDQILN